MVGSKEDDGVRESGLPLYGGSNVCGDTCVWICQDSSECGLFLLLP